MSGNRPELVFISMIVQRSAIAWPGPHHHNGEAYMELAGNNYRESNFQDRFSSSLNKPFDETSGK